MGRKSRLKQERYFKRVDIKRMALMEKIHFYFS